MQGANSNFQQRELVGQCEPSKSKNYFKKIPFEILLHIFSFLNQQGIISLTLTSKRFFLASQDNSLNPLFLRIFFPDTALFYNLKEMTSLVFKKALSNQKNRSKVLFKEGFIAQAHLRSHLLYRG